MDKSNDYPNKRSRNPAYLETLYIAKENISSAQLQNLLGEFLLNPIHYRNSKISNLIKSIDPNDPVVNPLDLYTCTARSRRILLQVLEFLQNAL